jgi:hypothetical protein
MTNTILRNDHMNESYVVEIDGVIGPHRVVQVEC